MQHDKKVGLALAILLVSIVGAFFFREESPRGTAPELKNPDKLDEVIAQGRDKRPYNDTDSSKPRTHEVRRPTDRPKDDLAPWELPDFLRDDEEPKTAQRGKVNASKDPFAPDELKTESPKTFEPVPAPKLRASTDNRAVAVPLPAENSEWLPLDNNKRVAQREAPGPTVSVTKGRTHTVVAGETLSSIAEKYLGSQTRYHDIYQANRDQLRSPNDLKVGMKLSIPDQTAGTKSNGSSRTLEANPVTKSQRPTFTAPTGKNTNAPATDSSSNTPPTKLKFKPSKSGPTFRRSANASDETTPGKSLSQLPPSEFDEVDDGLLAELEEDMELDIADSQAKSTDSAAMEPSPFRIASEETENAGLDE